MKKASRKNKDEMCALRGDRITISIYREDYLVLRQCELATRARGGLSMLVHRLAEGLKLANPHLFVRAGGVSVPDLSLDALDIPVRPAFAGRKAEPPPEEPTEDQRRRDCFRLIPRHGSPSTPVEGA